MVHAVFSFDGKPSDVVILRTQAALYAFADSYILRAAMAADVGKRARHAIGGARHQHWFARDFATEVGAGLSIAAIRIIE
jgi:hypothetical protein